MSTTAKSPVRCWIAALFVILIGACSNSSETASPLDGNPAAASQDNEFGATSETGTTGSTADSNVTDTTAGTNLNCDSDGVSAAMLTLFNNARATDRQCGSISYSASEALTWNTALERAAVDHNNDMVDNNFFGHTGSDGLGVSDRITAQGYSWRAVGENIAAGQRTTTDAVAGWLASAGHCSNIMSPDYADVAVSCRIDDRADYGVYWTAIFAR